MTDFGIKKSNEAVLELNGSSNAIDFNSYLNEMLQVALAISQSQTAVLLAVKDHSLTIIASRGINLNSHEKEKISTSEIFSTTFLLQKSVQSFDDISKQKKPGIYNAESWHSGPLISIPLIFHDKKFAHVILGRHQSNVPYEQEIIHSITFYFNQITPSLSAKLVSMNVTDIVWDEDDPLIQELMKNQKNNLTNDNISGNKPGNEVSIKNENIYHTIFENSHDAILTLGENGILDCNSAAVTLFGVENKQELYHKTLHDLSPEYQLNGEASEIVLKRYLEHVYENKNQVFHIVFKRKDGCEFKSEVTLKYLNNTDEKTILVTLKKVIFPQKNESNSDLFKNFFNSSSQGIVWTDLKGKVFYTNPAFLNMLKLDNWDCIKDQPIVHFVDNYCTEKFKKEVIPFTVTYGKWMGELSYLTSDKRILPTLNHFFLVQDIEKDSSFIAGIVADITNRKLQEITIQENEKRLKKIIEKLQIAIVLVDADTFRIVDVNAKGAKMIGLDKEEIIGKICHEYICPDNQGQCPIINLNKIVDNSEKILKNAKGEELNIFKSVNPINFDNRRYLVESFIDITDKKKSERELKQNEERIKRILEQSPFGMAFIGGNNKIITVNEKFSTMLGYQVNDLVDHNFMDLIVPEDLKNEYDNVNRLFTGEVGYIKIRLRFLKKNNEEIWGNLTASVLQEVTERSIYGLAMVEDISDQLKAEEALRASEEKFRIISDSAHDAIVMMDHKGKISFWNQAAERIFGYKKKDAIGKDLHGLLVSEIYNELFRESFPNFQMTGEGNGIGNTVELNALNKNKKEFPVELSLTSVKIHDQWHAIGIIRDVTERKKFEEDLKNAKNAAENASRSKSEFLANMSHEIRTPMNGILGMTDLMSDTTLSSLQNRYVKNIRHSAEWLLEIINDILDFSKIEARKMKIQSAPFNLRNLIRNSLENLFQQAQNKGLKLIYKKEMNVEVNLFGDATRLRQIIINLVSNAIKFTDTGEISLHIKQEEHGYSKHKINGLYFEVDNSVKEITFLHFIVSDTGIGIQEDKKEDIFESFKQVNNSKTKRVGGTGLGLAICKQLVELMNGSIWVESETGVGSAFHFTLPFGVTESIEETVELENSYSKLTIADGKIENGKNALKILLVEDDKVNQEVAVGILSKHQHQVTIANNGEEALNILRDQNFDIILMDIQMPIMDGFETTRRIREGSRLQCDPKIPIIALTAFAMKGDRENCINAGMDNYITKPLNSKVVLNLLSKYSEGLHQKSTENQKTKFKKEFNPDDQEIQNTINYTALLEQLDNDVDLLIKVWTVFRDSTPTIMENLKTAIDREEKELVIRFAHTLKGASANIGANIMRKKAEILEIRARENIEVNFHDLFKSLKLEFEKVQQILVHLLKRHELKEIVVSQ